MSSMMGTKLEVKFSRVVDGDTILVFLPGQTQSESLRILALDTEESYARGSKPVTPWGLRAKERAIEFFSDADLITIEFPGHEDVKTCLEKYRGNFGRLLVYVHHNGINFQEMMIREGYSPYFTKYGYADLLAHHQIYLQAERIAQSRHIGVWDQETVNGRVRRNYAALSTWWQLRAQVIDEYRTLTGQGTELLNTRLDYGLLKDKAHSGENIRVFTELRSIRRIGGDAGIIEIGSVHQPFGLFIPNMVSMEGQEIVRLLEARYISGDEHHLRRSYAYVAGPLSLYHDKPQIRLSSVNQITDDTNVLSLPVTIKIQSLLPDPEGQDRGNEQITLVNNGMSNVDLRGWLLQDRSGQQVVLEGKLESGKTKKIVLNPKQMILNNNGDEVLLIDLQGRVRDLVSYTANNVLKGKTIEFSV